MKKTHKVVILPTKEAKENIDICKLEGKNNLLITKATIDLTKEFNDFWKPQHLYIISDDEIKEGNWFIGETGIVKRANKIGKNNAQIHTSDGYVYFKHKSKKIVATTDESLQNRVEWTDKGTAKERSYQIEGLPSIPESFIQTYIKTYNESKPITEVDLEMEEHQDYIWNDEGDTHSLSIKTRPDNTVIIHQSKIYSKEDIITFLCDNFLQIRNTIPDTKLKYKEEYFINLTKNIEDYGK